MDKCSHAKESSINVGDTVIIKQPKHNKLTSKFKANHLLYIAQI